jgi:hypothetical protein
VAGVATRSALVALAVLASCAQASALPGPDTDAPERRPALAAAVDLPADYAEALRRWQSAEELNAWIGAVFEYDSGRAIELSETQRAASGRIEVHPPAAFFASPTGICVDLARFAVETLRSIAPASRPKYLMIEFDPVTISGNVLRRHWLVVFEREKRFYFLADSRRPGYLAGPYATIEQFVDEYAQYRGRRIAAWRSLDSYERTPRRQAPKALREART